MLYTRKQMEREIDRRLQEEHLRRSMEEEICQLNRRIFELEERLRTLEYKICRPITINDIYSGTVPTNTEVRA